MTKRNKIAPELEMLIFQGMREHAVCQGVNAVTVEEASGAERIEGANWRVSNIHIPSGVVPPAVREICDDIAADLATQYDLMIEYEVGDDES